MSLARYRKRTGLADQRLLVFCDATMSSGTLRVDSTLAVGPAGFDAFYFIEYPAAAAVLAETAGWR